MSKMTLGELAQKLTDYEGTTSGYVWYDMETDMYVGTEFHETKQGGIWYAFVWVDEPTVNKEILLDDDQGAGIINFLQKTKSEKSGILVPFSQFDTGQGLNVEVDHIN